MLTAFRCYEIYLSVQAHFSRDKYNAFQYRFKTNAKFEAFQKRRDRHFFAKLSNTFTREADLIEYLVANMVADNKFVGDMDRETYLRWSARKNSLFYNFKLDMKKLICYIPEFGFDAVFISNDNGYPILLQKYMAGEVSLESVVLFHKLTGAVNQMPDFDPLVWPDLKRKILKYDPFLQADRDKYQTAFMDIMKDVIADSNRQ